MSLTLGGPIQRGRCGLKIYYSDPFCFIPDSMAAMGISLDSQC